MPQQRRQHGGRRGFDQLLHPRPQQAHRGDGLGVVDGQHFDRVDAQQVEVRRAERAAQAVADCVGDQVGDARAALQRGECIRGTGGFGRIDLAAWRQRRGGDRAAAGEAAAADRHDQRIEHAFAGHGVARHGVAGHAAGIEQFECGGALPGDDVAVGIGMHQHRAGRALHVGAQGFARGDGGGAVVQGRAVGLDRDQLRAHRAFGHDHVAGNAAIARRQRQRRAMVARGVGDHATCRRRIGQRPYRIAGAAELEGADALQVLGLEVQFRADQCIDAAGTQHRGDVCVRGDPRRGGEHVGEGRQGQGRSVHGGNASAEARVVQLPKVRPERLSTDSMARAEARGIGMRWRMLQATHAGRDPQQGATDMIRKLLLPLVAVALLGGCVSYGYSYRQGAGDYYYGAPSVDYRYYSPYSYGSPYSYYGGGYSYYGPYRYGYPYGG